MSRYIYQRIDQRVDQMVARGLVEEVQGLTERMGGTIGAALEGDTFSVTVTFPLAGPPEGEAE